MQHRRKTSIAVLVLALVSATAVIVYDVRYSEITVLYVGNDSYEYTGKTYNSSAIMSQLSKDYPREWNETSSRAFSVVFDFGNNNAPIKDFLALYIASYKDFAPIVRFRYQNRDYVQTRSVGSSLGLSDIVFDLNGKPQKEDYRSFVTVFILPFSDRVKEYSLGDKKFTDYLPFFQAVKSRFAEYKGVSVDLASINGMSNISDYCVFLDAAREARIDFVDFRIWRDDKTKVPSPTVVPEILGPEWPFSEDGMKPKVIQLGNFWEHPEPPKEPALPFD
jgi:hypothetical protein